MKCNYKITEVDEPSDMMLVVYSCDGEESVTVSMPVPRENEDTEALIESYSPVVRWAEAKRTKRTIEAGTEGSLVLPTPASTEERVL
jgi:hypothetical protein